MKNIRFAMEEVSLLLLVDDMIICMENWRDCNERLF